MQAPAHPRKTDNQCTPSGQGGASGTAGGPDDASTEDRSLSQRVAVLLPLPLPEPYDYAIPEGMTIEVGQFVTVPLGKRHAIGVVWGAANGDVAAEKMREIVDALPAPPMRPAMRALVDWVANYTVMPRGAVLRMAMSSLGALEAPRTETVFRLVGNAADVLAAVKMTAARRRVVDFLTGAPAMAAVDIAREAAVGPGTVKGLVAAGLVEAIERVVPRNSVARPDPDTPGPQLGEAQSACASLLVEAVDRRQFGVSMLDGVPGAGKTEVYFEAVAAALRAGRQVLVLLPEIALSAQWLERFSRRFGARPAEWHSDLTSVERRATWRAVAEGIAKVVVGARSALFLPFQDLGLIVVDEEHDASFKQDDGVVYNARDMAVVRARLEACPIVLCSATPSLESWNNACTGRYDLLRLPDRHGAAGMPPIVRVDLRRDTPSRGRFISNAVRQAIGETLQAGEQALLFLNRRGYAPLTLCRSCGHRLECPNCRAWLVQHRFRKQLVCHHCGFNRALPPDCPACLTPDPFVACGPGVERVAEEARLLFPEARLAIFSSDTITSRRSAQELIGHIENGDVDIVIGTQMAAKGYHFPNLTLVAVVDADLGLAGGDLRAAERTFQLLYQVTGRAGRAERPGRAMLQSWDPQHRVIAALASGDREAFLATELAEREAAGMPPFGRLAALIVSGTDEKQVDDAARNLARHAPRWQGVQIWGPVPPPLAVLRGRFRRRLLLVAVRGVNVGDAVREWLATVVVPGTIRVQVDIDPYSFL